jgi:hypothetical protein
LIARASVAPAAEERGVAARLQRIGPEPAVPRAVRETAPRAPGQVMLLALQLVVPYARVVAVPPAPALLEPSARALEPPLLPAA